MSGRVTSHHDNGDNLSGEEYVQTKVVQDITTMMNDVSINSRGRFIKDDELQQGNKRVLRKFEPLNVKGKSLTGLSIGGFDVDLSQAAQKAMEVLPLPAAKLPVIFVDDDLNLLHHFFQGVAKKIGDSTLERIARKGEYYDDEYPVILPLIEELTELGYETTDDEMTILMKRIFMATFEIISVGRGEMKKSMAIVVSNLYGFQYIEQGMKLDESGLQMWIHMAYAQYRTAWFNNFKSSGIPSFAKEGSNKTRSMSSTSSVSSRGRHLEMIGEDDNESVISRRTHKRHSKTSKSSAISSKTTGRGNEAVLAFLSGRH